MNKKLGDLTFREYLKMCDSNPSCSKCIVEDICGCVNNFHLNKIKDIEIEVKDDNVEINVSGNN